MDFGTTCRAMVRPHSQNVPKSCWTLRMDFGSFVHPRTTRAMRRVRRKNDLMSLPSCRESSALSGMPHLPRQVPTRYQASTLCREGRQESEETDQRYCIYLRPSEIIVDAKKGMFGRSMEVSQMLTLSSSGSEVHIIDHALVQECHGIWG